MMEPCLEFTNIYIYVNNNFLQLPPYDDYIVYELAPPDRKTFVSWRYLKELEIGKKKKFNLKNFDVYMNETQNFTQGVSI